jgi:hypothetical protein
MACFFCFLTQMRCAQPRGMKLHAKRWFEFCVRRYIQQTDIIENQTLGINILVPGVTTTFNGLL